MNSVTIRIYFRDDDGAVEDGQEDYDLSQFGGFLPAIGDRILAPGVLQGRDRHNPRDREIWVVVDRVFNPRDLRNYVALVVEEHPVALNRAGFAGGPNFQIG